MPYQFRPLPASLIDGLRSLDAATLRDRGARRMRADSVPGFPCRVSLREAPVGASVLLVNHRHLTGNTPYAASHAIFVDEAAEDAVPEPGQVPEIVRNRLVSIRGFDAEGMIVDADVTDGTGADAVLARLFGNPAILFADVHAAARGCFLSRAHRIG